MLQKEVQPIGEEEEEQNEKSSRRNLIVNRGKILDKKETLMSKFTVMTDKQNALAGILGDEVKKKMN